MSMRPRRKIELPLKNITSTLNFKPNRMSYTGDSVLSSSPMSSLAATLSELSTRTGRGTTPRLRRKLSLSSLDTPPNGNEISENEPVMSAESGCFSGSSLDDSPTLESLSLKRYTAEHHPDIPLEAFSVKKRTISFRRFSSEPIPALRLDSPTDFLDEDKDDGSPSCDADEEVSRGEGTSGFRIFGSSSEETCSQDSGLGMESDRLSQLSQRSSSSSFDDGCSVFSSTSSLNQLDRLPSLEDVWNSMDAPGFKAPQGKPPKRRNSLLDERQYSEETCSPIKYSPVKSSSLSASSQALRPSFPRALFSQIPEDPNEGKEKSDVEVDDDGFRELFKLEDVNNDAMGQVSTLLSATLLHQPGEQTSVVEDEHPPEFKKVTFLFNQQKDATPSSRPAHCRRGLHRSQSLDIRRRPSIKRAEPSSEDAPGVSGEPFQSKRFRGEVLGSSGNVDVLGSSSSGNSVGGCSSMTEDSAFGNSFFSRLPTGARRLTRCHSETEAMIKSAVSRMFDEPDLIGDCSKPYYLPTIQGKHQDLKSISPETLSQLIEQQYADDIEEFHIIDCRYPYEFEGGHIKDAFNLYTKEAVKKKYIDRPWVSRDPSKRRILVFHCEFSSERGPGLFRYLRQQDREENKECYPFLHYPEIYLLEGGYKRFFETHSHLCEPRSYKTMFDKNHSEDLRKFRAKCKSDDKPNVRVRTLKF